MHYVRDRLKHHSSTPAWINAVRVGYHKYGLKYVVLVIVLTAYSFIGAGVFLFFERPEEQARLTAKINKLREARATLIRRSLDHLFNDSSKTHLLFVDAAQIEELSSTFENGLKEYEGMITSYYATTQWSWDLWTALIYSLTVITTIGYGYLHPTTVSGRIFTMLYALVGIPLMLILLSNLGQLLTKLMKYPFFLMKRVARRLFRYCTKMTHEQIVEADEKDKATLHVFDLPIPVAICIVIGWIFICSAITLIWEKEWDFFVAFYFFFISLSTIGFGDVTPSNPYYFFLMFGNILVGMALVSMVINLIQVKLEPVDTTAEDEETDLLDELSMTGFGRLAQNKQRSSVHVIDEEQHDSAVEDEAEKATGEKSVELASQSSARVRVGSIGDGIPKQHAERKLSSSKKTLRKKSVGAGAAMSSLATFLAPLFGNKQPETESTGSKSPLPPVRSKVEDLINLDDETKSNASIANPDQPTDQLDKPKERKVNFKNGNQPGDPPAAEDTEVGKIHGRSIPPASTLTTAIMDPADALPSSVRLRHSHALVSDDEHYGSQQENHPKSHTTRRKKSHKKMLDIEDNRSVITDHEKAHMKRISRPKRRRSYRKSIDNFENWMQTTSLIDTDRQDSPKNHMQSTDQKRHGHFRRAETIPVTTCDHDSHSECSICMYHPFDQHSDRHMKISDQNAVQPENFSDHCDGTLRQAESESYPYVLDTSDHSFPLKNIYFHDQQNPYLFRSEIAPQLRNCKNRIKQSHSEDIGHYHRPQFFQTRSEQNAMIGFQNSKIGRSDSQDRDAQTMISFRPGSEKSEERISVTGRAGTSRLLPETVSFNEINRLVELNIDAEILRNELAALAMAQTSHAAYRRVLDAQDFADQVGQEAALRLWSD